TSPTDVTLGDIATSAILAGKSVSISGIFTIPGGVGPGTKYVWVAADNNGVTNQSDGTNDYAHSEPVAINATNVAKPVILGMTGNQTITQGNLATFEVLASGSEPLSYQWKRGVIAILGATSKSLITGQAGTYSVDVSNSGGVTSSSASTLTVDVSSTTPAVII